MNRNPIDQLRAFRRRRAQEQRSREQVSGTRSPYSPDDTQPLVFGSPGSREEHAGPAPQRGRRRLATGLAVGAVAGGALVFGLPALAGGSGDAASQAVVSSSAQSRTEAGGGSTGSGQASPGADGSTPPSPGTASDGAGAAQAPQPPEGGPKNGPACGPAGGPAKGAVPPAPGTKGGAPAPGEKGGPPAPKAGAPKAGAPKAGPEAGAPKAGAPKGAAPKAGAPKPPAPDSSQGSRPTPPTPPTDAPSGSPSTGSGS